MENVTQLKTARRVRTVWISDVHLGFPGCSADHLAEFLRSFQCEKLYLVGDIIDFWYMRRRRYWSQAHNNVVRCIFGKAKHGTEVVYIPGNHDEKLRDYDQWQLGNIKICDDAIHETLDGRRLLVIHGDQFDYVMRHSRLLAVIGSFLYDWLLKANRVVNWVRGKLKKDYWSLAAFLKHKVKNAVQYIGQYEEILAGEAERRGVDGLICGHIHRAEISQIGDVHYLNCGDWVESCTALVELWDGSIELIHWADRREVLKVLNARSTRDDHSDAANKDAAA
ncbi:MAG: UDP-2,3-diacylglucosamine diphosphatase [Wenzhouxiangellaceae bacterium]